MAIKFNLELNKTHDGYNMTITEDNDHYDYKRYVEVPVSKENAEKIKEVFGVE